MGNQHGTGFSGKSTAEQVARDISLIGKNVIVTGANTGLGKETCRVLAKMGANVIMACRNMEKGASAKEEIEKSVPNPSLTLLKLDLSDLDSIESFVNSFNEMEIPLHILINNAGVMAIPYQETKNGFEMQFGTNHLGHFHLTNLLLPKLKEGQPARVVCLSSSAHKFEKIRFDDIKGKNTWYNGVFGRWNAYGQSKTANILFAVELNRRMHNEGLRITANALHPGVISTELARDLGAVEKLIFSITPLTKTIPQGAATTVYVATAPELEGIGGRFFENSNEAIAKPYATNPRYATKLWELSEQLIANAPRGKQEQPEEQPQAQPEESENQNLDESIEESPQNNESRDDDEEQNKPDAPADNSEFSIVLDKKD